MAKAKAPKRVKMPLKLYGAKGGSGVASWVVDHFPRDKYLTLLDGCMATGSIIMAHNPEGKSEIGCDLDEAVCTFWEVLRSNDLRPEFLRRLTLTPFAQSEFEKAKKKLKSLLAVPGTDEEKIEVARAVFVVSRQSLAGRWDDFAVMSTSRLRRGVNEQISSWLGATDVPFLTEVATRFSTVVTYNDNFCKVGRKLDKPKVLQYVDYPYLADSRASGQVYRKEASELGHKEMLTTVTGYKHALVVVSHNPHPMYDELLAGWRTDVMTLPNASASGKVKGIRQEKLWMNYDEAGERIV